MSNEEQIRSAKRPGGELRGNSRDQANRTGALLREFMDGAHAPCVYCGKVLDQSTLTQDTTLTGAEGGQYRLGNLLPSCRDCNAHRNDQSFFES
jgi:hypothetical protein